MLQLESTQEALESIKQKGYVELKNIFSQEKVEKVNQIIESPLNRPSINGSKGYIRKNNIRFLFATLSWGREIIELYTHPAVIRLIDEYVGEPVHLSNFRIYRTFPSRYERMAWHVDNKFEDYDEKSGTFTTHLALHDKGIIMIMYLSDVEDGGFQIVEGSHLWSFKEPKETWDDREKDFSDKIVTFNNRPKGTTIIYDYRCVHRAKPYQGTRQIRTSLFGQFSPSFMPVGEPILLNARDIDQLNDLQKRVLKVGEIPSSENWPIGEPGEVIEDLGLKAIRSLLFVQAKKAAKRLGIRKKAQ